MRTPAKARTGTGKITIDKDDALHNRRNQIMDISTSKMSYVKCMGWKSFCYFCLCCPNTGRSGGPMSIF